MVFHWVLTGACHDSQVWNLKAWIESFCRFLWIVVIEQEDSVGMKLLHSGCLPFGLICHSQVGQDLRRLRRNVRGKSKKYPKTTDGSHQVGLPDSVWIKFWFLVFPKNLWTIKRLVLITIWWRNNAVVTKVRFLSKRCCQKGVDDKTIRQRLEFGQDD